MTPTLLDTPCREWQGNRNAKGYGRRHLVGVGTVYVHRWVWAQVNGPIPKGLIVMHHCDNPPCFRYDHLFLGTYRDNQLDMIAKARGRGQFPPGPTHCKRGHAFDEANTHYKTTPTGRVQRICRACAREWVRNKRAQRVPTPAERTPRKPR